MRTAQYRYIILLAIVLCSFAIASHGQSVRKKHAGKDCVVPLRVETIRIEQNAPLRLTPERSVREKSTVVRTPVLRSPVETSQREKATVEVSGPENCLYQPSPAKSFVAAQFPVPTEPKIKPSRSSFVPKVTLYQHTPPPKPTTPSRSPNLKYW